LSTDDIVFEDVTYREPRRVRRPDRDRRFTCIAYELPAPGDLPIFLDRKPADAIERHALRDTRVELGGILLGQECVDDVTDEAFVWVTEAIEAKHYENTQASFTYTHDSWEEITRERDRLYPDLDIVGWYHTHPDFGIFLSSHDLFIHHHFFSQPLQVAYVVDPIRQTRGFFQWRDGQMEQVGGFYLSAERGDRVLLARLVNELENFPNTDGSGGSFSPRLEAELIAMLTRQHQPVTVAAPQSAAAFALLGMLLGAILVVGALWLQSLTKGLQDQTDLLKSLDKNLAQSAKDHEHDVEIERIRAKEEMLNGLLAEVKAGTPPSQFLPLYTKAVEDRDAAKKALTKLQTENTALADLDTKLRSETRKQEDELESERKKITKLEESDKTSTATIDKLKGDVALMQKQFDESKTGELLHNFNIAWYVAAGGIGLSVILGLGLIAVLARGLPEEGEPEKSVAPTTIT
jgi:proteasome lid subunit RPN8/RPN11